MGKSVLLAGASGLVGSHCLHFLLEDNYYERIILLSRSPLDFNRKDQRVAEHIINFDTPGIFDQLVKADHIICTLGTTIKKAGSKEAFMKVDFSYPVEIARAAFRNGAEEFLVVSSLGADPKSRIFYNSVKGRMEEAVSSIGFKSLTIFRPSLLLGSRKEFRLGEEIGKSISKLLSFSIPAKYKPIDAHEVAGAMVFTAKANPPGRHVIESGRIRKMYYNNL